MFYNCNIQLSCAIMLILLYIRVDQYNQNPHIWYNRSFSNLRHIVMERHWNSPVQQSRAKLAFLKIDMQHWRPPPPSQSTPPWSQMSVIYFTTRTPAVTDVFESGRNVGALRPGRCVGFRSLASGIADDI